MKKWIILLILFAVSLSLRAANVIQADQEKAKQCVACHGADGNSQQAMWPKIAGQNQKYLLKQLQDFKKGKAGGRYNAAMEPIMANLTAQDLQDLAVFYANQKGTIETASTDNLALGQRLYRGGDVKRGIVACGACHGPDGSGNAEAGFPRLSGQHAAYVVKQLQDYRSGERKNGVNNIMQSIAMSMTDKDVQAVANYISGLH